MKKPLYVLGFVLALATAPALAQPGSADDDPQQSATKTSSGGAQSGAAAGGPATEGSRLQSQIQNALQNEPTLAKEQVSVEVDAGTVRLSGMVGTRKERKTALRIARSYAGHRRVINKITLRASEWTPSGNSAPGTGDGVPTSAAPDSNNPEIPPSPQK